MIRIEVSEIETPRVVTCGLLSKIKQINIFHLTNFLLYTFENPL